VTTQKPSGTININTQPSLPSVNIQVSGKDIQTANVRNIQGNFALIMKARGYTFDVGIAYARTVTAITSRLIPQHPFAPNLVSKTKHVDLRSESYKGPPLFRIDGLMERLIFERSLSL